MSSVNKTIRIFTMPQQYPCGAESSCCGPVGQTEEDIQKIKDAIEQEIGSQVEVIDTTKVEEMKSHLEIVRLVRSLGPMALPVITLNKEVVLMGNPKPEEVISAIKEKTKGSSGDKNNPSICGSQSGPGCCG